MRVNVTTDERGRLVATVSGRAGTRIAGTALGAASGTLGATFVLASMSGVGRWWLVPVGLAVFSAGTAVLAAANRVERWVFDGVTRRVERHRAALVPLEPTTWMLDDVLEVGAGPSDAQEQGAAVATPVLELRMRSGERILMLTGRSSRQPLATPGAAEQINEFLGAWR